MKSVAVLGLSLGVATVVAGSMAFAFGLHTSDVVRVTGFGPLDGLWVPADYCFLGTTLAAVGAGLLAYCLAWVVLLFRHGQAICPRRRWLMGSAVLAVGTAGAGLGATALLSQRGPRLTPGDAGSAKIQVAVFLALAGEGKDVKAMTTPEYQLRESAQERSVSYRVAAYQMTSVFFHHDGKITVSGVITANGESVSLRLGNGGLVGRGVALQTYPAAKEVGYTARLVPGDGGKWLIDEMEYHEK